MKAYMKDCSTYGDLSSSSYVTTDDNNERLAQPNFDTVEERTTGSSSNDGRKKFTKTVDPLLKDLPEDVHEDEYMRNKKLAAKEKAAASTSTATNVVAKDPTLWCEAKSDEGHTYYWNVKTNGNL